MADFVCQHCTKPFVKENCGKRVYRFCSHSCAVIHRRHAAGEVPTFETHPCVICLTPCERRAYPEKPVNRERVTCNKRCTGKLSTALRNRECESEVSRTCEACGYEFTTKIRNTSSSRTYQYCSFSCSSSAKLLLGYASGARKPPGYTRKRHIAHGYSFRSKLELCYANELVASGLRPGIDWEYEPHDLRVAYVSPDGEQHTYFPDFRVLSGIIEVKPLKKLTDDSVVAKATAARVLADSLGMTYAFVTEASIPSYSRRAR